MKHKLRLKRDRYVYLTTHYGGIVVGEFDNIYGEHYVITRPADGTTLAKYGFYHIAGDETDWEEMILDKSCMYAKTVFNFNDWETSEIKKIIKKDKQR